MANIAFPSAPLESLDISLEWPGQSIFQALYTGERYVYSRGVGLWTGQMTWPSVGRADDAATIRAIEVFLHQIEGAVNTFDVPMPVDQGIRLRSGFDSRANAVSRLRATNVLRTGSTMRVSVNYAPTGITVARRTKTGDRTHGASISQNELVGEIDNASTVGALFFNAITPNIGCEIFLNVEETGDLTELYVQFSSSKFKTDPNTDFVPRRIRLSNTHYDTFDFTVDGITYHRWDIVHGDFPGYPELSAQMAKLQTTDNSNRNDLTVDIYTTFDGDTILGGPPSLIAGDYATIDNRLFQLVSNLSDGIMSVSPYRPIVLVDENDNAAPALVNWSAPTMRARKVDANVVANFKNRDWAGPWTVPIVGV